MLWLVQYVKSLGDNFGCVEPSPRSIYRGAVPSGDTLRKCHKRDVNTILDLRNGDRRDAERKARAMGFEWAQVQMSDAEPPSMTQIRIVLGLLRAGRIFVHCQGGRHRTGLMIALWRVSQGWTKNQAWVEAKKYGWYGALGHQPLEDFFFDVDVSAL